MRATLKGPLGCNLGDVDLLRGVLFREVLGVQRVVGGVLEQPEREIPVVARGRVRLGRGLCRGGLDVLE
eukprot:312924-Alexandrium_andersonii.AAC.1